MELLASRQVTGVRIDHPDGLWDPAGYFADLQASAGRALRGDDPFGEESAGDESAAPIEAPDPGDALPLWLVVEKILEPGEALPADWRVHGTVGYEFARLATGVLVDPAGRKPFADLYARFTGQVEPFHDLVHDEKLRMLRTAFASELNVLASALNRISEHDRRDRKSVV